MATKSYASVAHMPLNHSYETPVLSPQEVHLAELSEPPPQSMTLVALLQVLQPMDTSNAVYLMPRSYLFNWLAWASHQQVSRTETARVAAAAKFASQLYGLEHVNFQSFTNPGPINASLLSMEGHPLLLRPNVVVTHDQAAKPAAPTESLRRVKSLPEDDKKEEDGDWLLVEGSMDRDGTNILCCAVPARFYETLRATHGVVCNDGFSVSFQPFPRDTPSLLHHHSRATSTSASLADHSNARPVEFRRNVVLQAAPLRHQSENGKNGIASPMSKLLKEEEKLKKPRMVPSTEVYPVKLAYKLVDSKAQPTTDKKKSKGQGFVLASRNMLISDVMYDLLSVAARQSSSDCKRVWSKRNTGATTKGDGYELVELDTLDGKLLNTVGDESGDSSSLPAMTVEEWVATHGSADKITELDTIIEVRRSNREWPRQELELCRRLQVGDFVDAQDATGKWYEALVLEVEETFVKVHYMGWASRWDSTVRRYPSSEATPATARIRAPVPLWTHSRRWRERLAEGKIIEVREASSLAARPKWYMGVIKKVGPKQPDTTEPEKDGAKLEEFQDFKGNSDTKSPLHLLSFTQQVLVEAEEELENNLSLKFDTARIDENGGEVKPRPPYRRWVSLFGEEICAAGTHLKIKEDEAVVTLRYEYEQGRKPVEVMKSFNNMFGQGFMKESLRGTPPAPGAVGMHNLGNSCFLNSIVQCLNHIDRLTQFFLQGDYVRDLNSRNPLGSSGRVATAYASLLTDIWSSKYSALAPRMLKQTVASFAPQFNNSFQHDSQEFCQFLMDGIHEDCNRVKVKPYVEELEGFGMEDDKAAVETWRKHLLRHDSIVVDSCQGMHRSHLTCPSCGRESIKFDVYSTISLPLATDKGGGHDIQLEDCLEKFMEGEQLDDLNAWYCPNCKKHVCALKMIALWSVPDILIVHLKRFQFEHCKVRNEVVRSKIDATVKFPIDSLDLRQYILGPIDEATPPVYKLFGVSEHAGPTANSGHYTATVRNSRDDRWYRYNDAHVGETTGDAAVTGGAYLLFYQRSKGQARWAGLEKVMKDKKVDTVDGDTDKDGFTMVKTKKKKQK